MKLEVKDASIGYKKQVLSSNINMASEPGMVTAILGQNGCGKTTFVKSLMKLIPWCGGGAFLDDVDMRNIKDRQLWRKMAYVPQKSTSVPYSVLDMVKAFEKACGKKIAYEIKPRRPGDIASCYANPTKAKVELFWEATRGLEQMCEDSWRWQSKNPDGYR